MPGARQNAAWSPVDVPAAEPIFGLWGDTTDDVFAVGQHGTILHHDGLSWIQQATPTAADLRAVWGTGPHDVYAVGDDATLLHYDGIAWTAVATAATDDFTSVFVAQDPIAPDHVFIGGSSGIYQSSGVTRPNATPTAAGNSPVVWGTSPTSVFAGTMRFAGIDLFNGSWHGSQAAVANEVVTAISGTSPSDVYTVGSDPSHYDGVAWSPGPFEAGLTSVAAAANGVFAVGPAGKLRHWDGSSVEPFVNLTSPDLNAVLVIGNVAFIADADGALDILIFRK